MGWRDRFAAAEPFVVGLGMPVAIALGLIVVPVQITQHGQIASITTRLEEAEKKAEMRTTFLDKRADDRHNALVARFEKMDNKFDDKEEEIRKLQERILASETDPKKMLEKVGVRIEEAFSAVSVANQVYILPNSKTGYEKLVSNGYIPKQISPIMVGFPVGPGIIPTPLPPPRR